MRFESFFSTTTTLPLCVFGAFFSSVSLAAPVKKNTKVLAQGSSTMQVLPASEPVTYRTTQNVTHGVSGVSELHPSFVGAARYGTMSGTRVAPGIGYEDRDGSYSSKSKNAAGGNNAVPVMSGTDLDYAIAGNSLNVVAMHELPGSPVRAGLKLSRGDSRYKLKFKSNTFNRNFSFNRSFNEFSPVISAAVNKNVFVAGEYTSGSQVDKGDDNVETTIVYSGFSPSVLYVGEGFDAGMKYEPTISIEETDGSFQRVGGVTVHGRIAEPSRKMVYFGVAKYAHTRNLSSDLKNSAQLTAGTDFLAANAVYTAYGIWNTASFKDSDGFNPDSTGRYGIGMGGNWMVARNGQVGADVKITSGEGSSSSDTSSEKIAEQTLTGTLAGSLVF